MSRRGVIGALLCLAATVATASPVVVADAPHDDAGDGLLPVVFVHGQSGSAQQFETQALRFTSNGYPQDLLYAFEYDTNSSVNPLAELDDFLDDVLAETGAEQVNAIGHSRGTSVWTAYLADAALGGAEKVARYVNVDGRTQVDLPGGVPTIGIWGEWNTADSGYNRRGNTNAQIGPDPADNFYFPDKSHTEVMTSPEAFAVMYDFLVGEPPATVDVVPEPPGRVEVAGRAVIFPANVGAAGSSLEIWLLDPATGRRAEPDPRHAVDIDATGDFGPMKVNGVQHYEFALTRPDGTVHHFYFEPFGRSDHFVRLNTSLSGQGLEAFVPRSPDSTGFVVSRQRELWGDQGAESDQLLVDGVDVLNPIIAPRAGVNLALFGFDAGLDQTTDLTDVPFPFGLVTFITAADVFLPSDPDASLAVTDVARGSGDVTTINVPRWPSDTNRITIQFRDDVGTDFPGSRRS